MQSFVVKNICGYNVLLKYVENLHSCVVHASLIVHMQIIDIAPEKELQSSCIARLNIYQDSHNWWVTCPGLDSWDFV